MLRHYMTKCRDDREDRWYAVSWVQLNLFGQCWCLSKRVIEIWAPPEERAHVA